MNGLELVFFFYFSTKLTRDCKRCDELCDVEEETGVDGSHVGPDVGEGIHDPRERIHRRERERGVLRLDRAVRTRGISRAHERTEVDEDGDDEGGCARESNAKEDEREQT